MTSADPIPDDLVLYDGVCGLCDRSVRWLIKRDRHATLRFAPLQGETTAALRARIDGIPEDLSSVVYLDHGVVRVRSKAFLHLMRHMRGPWKVLYYLRWLPGFLADLPYRLVAALRYRLFGKKDACTLPSPDERARFLP